MRESHRCPKCQHPQILRLSRVAGEMVYMSRPPGQAGGPTWRRAGPREAYICRACGYTEYYTLNLENLAEDGTLVEALSSDADGPFR